MSEYIEREAALSAQNKSMNLSECRKRLERIPAADVRPVVRGNWKHGVCQTCFFDWSKVAPLASAPNFCPNCGADMREES